MQGGPPSYAALANTLYSIMTSLEGTNSFKCPQEPRELYCIEGAARDTIIASEVPKGV